MKRLKLNADVDAAMNSWLSLAPLRRSLCMLCMPQTSQQYLHQRAKARQAGMLIPRFQVRSPMPSYATPTKRSDIGSPAQDGSSPGTIDIVNETDLMNTHGGGKATDEDGPSAADYDPTVDMKEDERRDERRHGNVGMHGEAPETQPEVQPEEQPEEPPAEKSTGDEEDDDFDMFAEDFDDDKYAAPKPSKVLAVDETKASPALGQPNGAILEGDDKDGYYKLRIGEILNGRYQVQSALGKGMFSGVARAVDITNKKLVAIKIMRNNDALRKGGFTEIAILQKLNDADPDNRKHIVKFERHFDHKGHLCMAFENLSLNLREVLKKFGNNVGINLVATRAYAHQIFIGLAHMRKCSVIHADLKPDNILVNESRNVLKICDLGTGIDKSDAATAHNEITPYLVSRFYRAPEIILGMPYDYSIDMWSIGCTLYELYTGKILFAGDSNNQMLKAIMEIRGKITPKLYKRGQLAPMHFDEQGNFVSMERDKVLGKVRRIDRCCLLFLVAYPFPIFPTPVHTHVSCPPHAAKSPHPMLFLQDRGDLVWRRSAAVSAEH
ncbi:serine threonine-protein kinase prp4 [Colletotrichum chrysophilum]|uniref:non-specific serine/threonine protein kinase n=1 Tax=Colletotrichum chrysophilum TaxID=1836956 RepID=A0AAD9EKQ8_9PEZI|nr:serine threonine-protein kinase prp4 [Colletotrichum chrysophilum]